MQMVDFIITSGHAGFSLHLMIYRNEFSWDCKLMDAVSILSDLRRIF